MKCGVSGSLTQELIDEERLNLQDLNRRDWYTQVFQVTKKINWIYEPSPVKNQRSTKTQETAELYWHIYFDRQIAENARQGLFERIDRVQEKIANGKALDENEQTLLEEVFENMRRTTSSTTPSTIKGGPKAPLQRLSGACKRRNIRCQKSLVRLPGTMDR